MRAWADVTLGCQAVGAWWKVDGTCEWLILHCVAFKSIQTALLFWPQIHQNLSFIDEANVRVQQSNYKCMNPQARVGEPKENPFMAAGGNSRS